MSQSVIPAKPRLTGREPGSRNTKDFWTPAPVPDHDPGFAGVTTSVTFYEAVKK